MEELWKDVKGYEGLYQVSSLGRVKAMAKQSVDTLGRKYIREERILSPRESAQTGYPQLNLSKNGEVKTFPVHRLVAEAFLPNPNNLPCINHKDESRNNNRVENLEWCTYRYNNIYGTASWRRKNSLIRYADENSTPVIQYTLDGEIVRVYKSVVDAERTLGMQKGSGIGQCCNRKLHTAYGFIWRFEGDSFECIEDKPKRHQKYVIKRDSEGNEVARYKSVSEAARENGFDRHSISRNGGVINGFTYEVEKKENEYIPVGHKGPRPDMIGRGAKKVYQYTKDGEFIREFESVKAAAIAMGDAARAADISNCANGKIPSAHGYDWRFVKRIIKKK